MVATIRRINRISDVIGSAEAFPLLNDHMDRLFIFDTTLRDGEQSPGASMTRDEKVRIARQLERLRVDVIEAGFPAASRGDFEAVQAGAAAGRGGTGGGLWPRQQQ